MSENINFARNRALIIDLAIAFETAVATGNPLPPEFRGKGILNGTTVPDAGLGDDGDFYINTATSDIYGPKTAGAWGAATSLKGADGIGTGDMLKTENLSGLASYPTARTNLGLGNVDNTSDVNKTISTATQTALDAKASLVGGTVPNSQLSDEIVSGLKYRGTWNATTNVRSPEGTAMPSANGANKGFIYVVAVAGATILDGITDWGIGDWAVSNGSTYDKIDNTEPPLDADLDAIAALTGNNKLLFRNASGVWVTRGLGAGLTDDGTNIVGGGSSLPAPENLSVERNGYYHVRNNSGASRTATLSLNSTGANTNIAYYVSTTASPGVYGASEITTSVSSSTATRVITGIVIPSGAVFVIREFSGSFYVWGTLEYTA